MTFIILLSKNKSGIRFEDFLTIIESNFVGNSTDFSNVGVEVRLNANVTDVENGCKDAAHLFKLL